MTRRELILGYMHDLAHDFLYYDRTEDGDLPLGEVEAAVAVGELSYAEIAEAFRVELEDQGSD